MSETLLEVTNLSIERGDRLLFDNLHFDISQGQVVQVAGPNGSGKTSLLRALAGLSIPLSGNFRWRDKDVSGANAYSDELLYVGHKPAVRLQLNPLENLRSFETLQGSGQQVTAEENLIDALTDLDLSGYEEEFCSRLSAGQKRRVGLARLRLTNAPLWILDEPFTAIDNKGVERLCAWIGEFVHEGGAVAFTTHQPVSFPNLTPKVMDLRGAC